MWHTQVKATISRRLGPEWSAAEIAERANLCRPDVTRALKCTGDRTCRARHGMNVQDAIAKAVGISTAELFGPHAWFRLAAVKLGELAKKKRAS